MILGVRKIRSLVLDVVWVLFLNRLFSMGILFSIGILFMVLFLFCV